MFKRQPTIINVNQPTRTEYVTREVREIRAPTDQSVALLKEMEKAAAEKIIEAVHVGDTSFECVVHMSHDIVSDQDVLVAVFSLNGKKMKASHAFRGGDHSAAYVVLRDEVAKVIATEMISAIFNATK